MFSSTGSYARAAKLGFGAILLSSLAGLGGCSSSLDGPIAPLGDATVMSQARQNALTPDLVLEDLKAGNMRYVAGKTTRRDYMDQARATARGQYPKAIVLGCLDSRVPPEVVFDQGIGDLFVGRVAGNVEDTQMLGSMEFGSKVAGAKLIVVLGHTKCGAVKGAVDQVRMDNLTNLVAQIEPAVDAVIRPGEERSSSNASLVERAVEENVRRTVLEIRQRSGTIAALEATGDLRVVGAVYDLETGKVAWLDS